MMFKVIFLKELLESIQNYRFMIALILGLTIIPLGIYVNGKDYQARYRNYQETVRIYEESHKTIQDVMHLGGAAFRPPSPLSIISTGVEYLFPSSIESEGSLITSFGAQTRFNNTRTLDNPQLYLYGALDMTFIISIVISLLAMLLTYNSVAGEKEQRTLSLICSNAVPKNLIISAKMLAYGVLLSLTFFLGILLGIFVLLMMGFEVWTGSGFILRFSLGVAVSIIYVLTFSNFGVLISSLNKRAVSAIISLMFCWAILFMIFPKASVIVSKIIKPVRSQQVIDLEKSQIRRQLEEEEFNELQKLRNVFPVVKDMSMPEFMKKLKQEDKDAVAYDKKQNELKDYYQTKCAAEWGRVDSFYENQRLNQAGLARDISRLSPISCFVHLMAELSNTGLLEYKQWKQTRSRLKQLLDSEINDKMRRVNFGEYSFSRFNGDENALMSRIEYQLVPFRKVWSAVWPDFVLLLLYGIMFFLGAYVVFLKYDVR